MLTLQNVPQDQTHLTHARSVKQGLIGVGQVMFACDISDLSPLALFVHILPRGCCTPFICCLRMLNGTAGKTAACTLCQAEPTGVIQVRCLSRVSLYTAIVTNFIEADPDSSKSFNTEFLFLFLLDLQRQENMFMNIPGES